MKKFLPVMLGILCTASLLVTAFTACDNSDDDLKEQPQKFTITAVSGEGYTISTDKSEAEFGETVTVTVNVTDPDKYIDGVFAGDSEISESSENTYTYNVTDNTTFTVRLADYTAILTADNGKLVYSDTNPSTIVAGGGNGSYWEGNELINTVWELNTDVGWIFTPLLSNESYVKSSNQSVIPDSAITIVKQPSGEATPMTDIIVRIDSTKISAGTTWLEMYFRSGNNGMSDNGTLCVKITVTDSE